MNSFVLDASVALSWFFEDEFSLFAESIGSVMPQSVAVVPVVWPLEIANAFVTGIRRGKANEPQALAAIDAINRLQVEIDREIELDTLAQRTMILGITHTLSAYDASYLELAMRRDLPLATEDAKLVRAAAAAGVAIVGQ